MSASAAPLAALACRCYPNMAVRVDECDAGWSVRLTPVGELTRLYDADLDAALSGMDLSSRQIMSWHRLKRVGPALWLEAMCRSWALLAWSHWLRRDPHRRPLIVHVGRSDDLGAPTLVCRDGENAPHGLTAILESQAIDVREPDTIRAAIERGLIGVDAYIAPLLAERPGDIVHLTPASEAGDTPRSVRFDVTVAPQAAPSHIRVREAADGRCSYRAGDDPASLTEAVDGRAVLLNIDLSYFDLVEKRRRRSHVAPCTVDQLIDGLRPMAGALAAVTLAYSPGSCPSARWPGLAEALRAKLAVLLGAAPARMPVQQETPRTAKAFTEGTHRAVAPGRTLERVTPHLDALGITRIADITGLDRIGIPVMAAYRPQALSVAVSLGKGASPDAARVSAVMESIELWHAERPALARHWGSAEDLAAHHRLVDWAALPMAASFRSTTPTAWVEGRSLRDDRTALIPYEMVHADGSVPEPEGSGWFLCTSNGLASGNTLVEARTHALCELIERDAVTLWHLAGDERATLIAPETVADTGCRQLLERFAAAGFGVVLVDATSDIGVPVAIAAVFDDHPDIGPQMGMGCHPSRDIALSRALTEAAQSRLTLISGARDDLFRDRYASAERTPGLTERFRHLETLAPGGRSFSAMPHLATDSLEGDHHLVVDALARRGFEPHWVDLTQPDVGVSVVRVVVPGLEPPSEVAGYRPGPRVRAAIEGRLR